MAVSTAAWAAVISVSMAVWTASHDGRQHGRLDSRHLRQYGRLGSFSRRPSISPVVWTAFHHGCQYGCLNSRQDGGLDERHLGVYPCIGLD